MNKSNHQKIHLQNNPLTPIILRQWSPTFLAQETSFVENNFFMKWKIEGSWYPDDSSTLHL